MDSRKVSLRGGYVLIEAESDTDSSSICDCTGIMEIAEQIAVHCNDDALTILEPILVTVRSALWTGGGANYFVHVVARYEPDASQLLHVWVAKNFMEKDKDRAYFSYIPQLAINSAMRAIQQDAVTCGGYLCFCRIISNPVDNRNWAYESAIQGIINLIKSNYTDLSDKQIQMIFEHFC